MVCLWYDAGVCNEKHCNGEGYVYCRSRKGGIVADKLRGEYSIVKPKSPEMSQIRCLSYMNPNLLEKSIAQSFK